MEEIDELRAKVIASMASSGNPNSRPKRKSSSREEGELSSGDEEIPTCSGLNFTVNTSAEPAFVNLTNGQRKRSRSGNILPASSSPSLIAAMQQRRSTLVTHKRIKKLPNKSHNAAWHGRSGSNDNLIISFSDGDDTDSNSEESNSEGTVKEKVDKDTVDRLRIAVQASPLQPEVPQCRPNILSTETSSGCPSIPFLTNVRGSYSRTSGPSGASVVEKGTPIEGHDSTKKISLNQELGHVSDMNMTDDKVRSLRQQIAVRENELRLQKRSLPESKDGIACFDGHHHENGMKLDAKAPRIDGSFGSTSSIKENKHLKPDEHPCSKVNSDGLPQLQLPLIKSVSETKKQALETTGQLIVAMGSHKLTGGTALEKNDIRINEQRGESDSSLCISSGMCTSQMKDKEPSATSNQAVGDLCKRRMSSPPKTPSLKDMNFINNLSQLNLQEQSSMDREVLLHVEELHDKELEEAQELRRQCEIEEMRALKAYRKAREALIAANSRCSFLYRRRELLSLFASRWLSRRETLPKTSDDLLSELNHLMDAEGEDSGQVGYKCRSQFADGPLITSNPQTNGDDLSSDKCCKHDAIVINPDHMITHSRQPNTLMDVEQVFPINNASMQLRTVHEDDEVNVGVKTVNIDVELERASPVQHIHDFELEASLRSKLFARLGIKSATKTSTGGCNADRVKGSEMGAENERSDVCVHIVPSSPNPHLQEGDKINQGASNRNVGPVEANSFQNRPCGPKHPAILSISPVLQPICKHIKILLPESSISRKDVVSINFTTAGRDKEHDMSSSSLATVGSHNGDFAIDPFWPLCMFELRGKCNDDECPWQHLKDCTRLKRKQIDSTNFSSDKQADYPEDLAKVNDASKFPRSLHHNLVSVPTYRIGSSLIKSDTQLSQSLLARSMWRYWQIGFCTFFPLPFSVQRILPPDAPFLHAGEVHATDDDNWNRPSLYFSSEDSTMLKQDLSDPEQTLEVVCDLFNRKINNMHLRKKALSLLARAIEADPNSVVLWIVYLHIYYWKEKCVGKDDMFFHAVRFNEDSYELWLLYINSRMHIDDRMNAYDNALSVLCQSVHAADKESKCVSACILDLSLQMIDFLCLCGDVDQAISRVYELGHAAALGTSDHTLLSDILPCLIVSDRCIFWVCCIYVVVYRKLPAAIVQQFELEKDLPFVIEWPTTNLSTEEKCQALELMEKAVDSLALDDDTNLYEKVNSQDNVRRSAHFLAISHIKCVAALKGLGSATGLLMKYVRMYPTCVELLLISARLQKISTKEVFIENFEEVMRKWPKEISGSQCLWNQYADYVLECGRVDLAEKLMERWFHSFCEIQDLQCGKAEATVVKFSDVCELPWPLLPAASVCSCKKDAVFGWLNLCLYKLLQKNAGDARLAVDKALHLATEQEFRHCVREHAAFLFYSGSNPLIAGSNKAIVGLLNSYLLDIRSCSRLEPLSRRFYMNVKKSRLRQLISSILGPVSLDFSLLNSVLEVLYGPSLLPETFKEPKDLVDYVESLMAIVPANYQLALSAYSFVCCNQNRTAFSSKNTMFWVSSLLANSVFQSFPVAPESVWLEVANVLSQLEIRAISEAFHQQAVSVYPFSLKLWQSYLNFSKTTGNSNSVLEAAKNRGFELS